jgi:lysophospholipase L1-like esterase
VESESPFIVARFPTGVSTEVISSVLFLLVNQTMTPPAKVNYLINPGFDNELVGWEVKGDVSVSSEERVKGKSSVRIGKAGGSLSQTYKVPGERILWISASFHSSAAKTNARISATCLDRSGKVLLSLTAEPNSNPTAGIYFKTHSYTDRLIVKIENVQGSAVTVDDAQLNDEDKTIIRHNPEVSLDEAMKPFWEGHRIFNESVLLLSSSGESASGRLLFAPTKIISVTDPTHRIKFTRGVDFDVKGNQLVARGNSKIQTMSDKEFATGEFPWTRFDGRHVFVTYEHKSLWSRPYPRSQGEFLPRTVAKLKARKQLRLAAFGDSITLGINVSGFLNTPPYLPPWPSLVAHKLGNVKLFNVALGGASSQWAKDNAKDLVGSLKPDLVLIAFGMNDFWSLTPKLFIANIKNAIDAIRSVHPATEFLLISSMKFDPDYTKEEPYVGNLAGYASELRALSGKGVAFFDMTELSQALYSAKSSKDLTTDPMHPDDFLARCYAQGVVATIQPN